MIDEVNTRATIPPHANCAPDTSLPLNFRLLKFSQKSGISHEGYLDFLWYGISNLYSLVGCPGDIYIKGQIIHVRSLYQSKRDVEFFAYRFSQLSDVERIDAMYHQLLWFDPRSGCEDINDLGARSSVAMIIRHFEHLVRFGYVLEKELEGGRTPIGGGDVYMESLEVLQYGK